MKYIKKIVILSIIIVLSLVIVLFTIQAIDYVINGRTYSAVDNFFKNLYELSEKDTCLIDFSDIRKYNIQSPEPTGNIVNKEIEKPFKPGLYSKTILSCNQYKKDLAIIEIPQNIPIDKQTLLKKSVKLNSDLADSILVKVNKYKNCNNKISEKALADSVPFQTYKINAELKLTEVQARKRFSFRYIFRSIPQKYAVDVKLKKIR